MENYTKLIGSNNIIEVEKIVYALKNREIHAVVKGKKALEIGNVELTGIEGASIMVPIDQLPEAIEVMEEMGYQWKENTEIDKNMRKAYIVLGLLLFMVIIFLVIVALIGQ